MAAETGVRLDRRQRKTRAALHAALLRLVADKPYADITVEDVVTAADVARATFYAHYRDKNDLLAAVNEQLIAELTAVVSEVSWQNPPGYTAAGIQTILRHVEGNRAWYQVLTRGEAGPAARALLIDNLTNTARSVFEPVVKARKRTLRADMPMITTAFVGALLLVIEQWLAGTLEGDATSLAASFMQTLVGGLEWALGFDAREMRYQPFG